MEADYEDAKPITTWDELWVRTALDMNDIGSWELDLRDNTSKRTPAHDRIFGYETPLDEWTYEIFLEHVLPEDRARVDELQRESIAQQKNWDFECRIRRKDDEVRWIRASGRPLSDSQGVVRRFVGAVRDITDHKKIGEQLVEARKLEAVGQLTAGVSHYFNNLLAVMMLNIDMLQNIPSMPEEAKPLIAGSLRAVKRGSDLTRQLLAYARKWTLSPRVVDLGAEIQQAAVSLRKSVPETVQMQVLVAPQPIPALVDAGQLATAITNLTNNARDAMADEGILLMSVGIEDRATPDKLSVRRYGVITVQDTGCGMAPEVMTKAFDPFFTTKEFGASMGLGLSMVYGFMEQSQGRAELSSAVDKGTTVKLLFPLAVGKPEAVSVPHDHL